MPSSAPAIAAFGSSVSWPAGVSAQSRGTRRPCRAIAGAQPGVRTVGERGGWPTRCRVPRRPSSAPREPRFASHRCRRQRLNGLGRRHVTPDTVAVLRRRLSHADLQQLLQAIRYAPTWIADVMPRPPRTSCCITGCWPRVRRGAPTWCRAAPAGATTAPPVDDPASDMTPRPSACDASWADLMRRAFEVEVLACPRCGGRLRLIALIEASAVARRIKREHRPGGDGWVGARVGQH